MGRPGAGGEKWQGSLIQLIDSPHSWITTKCGRKHDHGWRYGIYFYRPKSGGTNESGQILTHFDLKTKADFLKRNRMKSDYERI